MRSGQTILAVVLALTGLAVASVWAPDRSVESLKPRWAPAPSRFITLDGAAVHYRDEGPRDDPQPLLLLHGSAASLHTWEGWTAALRDERRVIRLDLPGFGLTGPFQDGASSLARTLGVIERLLDTLGAPRVIVAGNSLGGLYAWQLAVRSPTRVAGLILVDPAGYPSQATSVPVGFKVAALPGMRYVASQVLPRRVIESSVRNVYGDPSRVTPELVDRYYELTLREGNRRAFTQRPRTGSGGAANRGGGLDTLQIATIRAPTLILWGELDRLIPPSNATRFARDIPGSRVVRFPTLGHVPHEEDPVASLAPVREFLGTIPR